MQIRPEAPGDEAAIGALTTEAFRTAPHSDGTEAAIIDALRADGALILSLVAVDGGRIVGQVTASPVAVGGNTGWTGIGPIAVLPGRQRQGVGSALMTAALDALRAGGSKGAVLVGDPAYYGRFGFASRSGLGMQGIPAEFVLALPFGEEEPVGMVAYHEAFTRS